MIHIKYLSTNLEKLWHEYLESHEHSTCYHSLAWKMAAERAYGLKTQYLIAFDDERPCGILPLFGVKGLLKSHFTNGLFGGSATILADSTEVKELLIKTAVDLTGSLGYKHFIFKTRDQDCIPNMEHLDSWVTAELSLNPDAEKVWIGLRGKIRQCVGRARREKLKTFWGQQHLEDFYDVLCENLHAKGSPIYGLPFLKELLKASGQTANVIVLKSGEKTVAGAMILNHKHTVSIPFASSRPKSRHLRPSHLLIWEIIKKGCADGMTTLDFGRSLRGSGALDFKLGWGAVTSPHPVYVFSRGRSQLNLDPNDVGWFVNNWKYLPRAFTDKIGPMICRQIAGLL
jgi:FemAB-related protein (PEP-CTERM system-associated)